MIDQFALALGHGLLAIALLRLVMRAGLDEDPLIKTIRAADEKDRKARSSAGRSAARREQAEAESGRALPQLRADAAARDDS